MKSSFIGLLSVFLTVLVLAPGNLAAQAAYEASPERSHAALGHYSRARAMLIEALAEFDQGKRLANPDLLLDSDKWRLTIVSRAEELNKVLDPKPRVTRSGVQYRGEPRLIRHGQKYFSPEPGPSDSNKNAERRNAVDSSTAKASGIAKPEPRARLAPSDPKAASTENSEIKSETKVIKEPSQKEPTSSAKVISKLSDVDSSVVVEAKSEAIAEESAKPSAELDSADNLFQSIEETQVEAAEKQIDLPADTASAADELTEPIAEAKDAARQSSELNPASDGEDLAEDPEITKAIEAAIAERLKKLEEASNQLPAQIE